MAFTAQALRDRLPDPGSYERLWIAYSGGMDSHVLLHAAHHLTQSGGKPLLAVHVNHGLSPNASHWQAHCEAVCAGLGVELWVQRAVVARDSGLGLESAARDARYAIFAAVLAPGDCLLTAHHENDQLETMLYHLLRGSGPRGLAGIPVERPLGRGRIFRPLLEFSQAELLDYGRREHLAWITDESNDSVDFDRNFLRHDILPRLLTRWPGLAKSWRRSAQLLGEADYLQTQLGEQDLARARTHHGNRLDVEALLALDEIRRRNALRVWFTDLNERYQLPLPGYNALRRIATEVLSAAGDGAPQVSWSDDRIRAEVRRYRGELYALKKSPGEADVARLPWPVDKELQLPRQGGCLKLVEAADGFHLDGIRELEVRFRGGGESVRPAGRKTRPLKKVLQDYGVPPWLRDQVPLIYAGDDLIAVADLFVSEDFQRRQSQTASGKKYRFYWEREDIHCGY